jgi:hypothetical protein
MHSLCQQCGRSSDDLTEAIVARHHQPLRVSILCLYLMGLNRSNPQIAQALDLHKDDVQQMTSQQRAGMVKKKGAVTRSADIEGDEIYRIAGHKGHPEAVQEKGEKDDETVSKGHVDEGRWRQRSHRSSA